MNSLPHGDQRLALEALREQIDVGEQSLDLFIWALLEQRGGITTVYPRC